MNTGERIKQRRTELGLDVDELAVKIGKSRATIYRYENGDIENMPTTVLEPIAKALETTPAYLMGWEEVRDITLTDKLNTLASANREELDRYATYLMLTQRQCISDTNKNEYIDYVVASYVSKLNRYGKKEAEKRIKELTLIPIYTDSSIPIAAHNDDTGEEQQQLMQEDIDEL